MSEQADLRTQATDLRRHGYSYSQIGHRLGVHKSVVARWVATVPFDGFNAESLAEQLSSVRDPHLYNRALELRLAGWSYKMIEAEVGVSRSTLSGWLRNVTFAEYDPRVQQRVLQAQLKATQRNRLRREVADQRIRGEVAVEMGELLADGLSDRELFFLGLMLYWAEGAKTHGHVGITNSDPRLVQMFVLWLDRCFGVGLDHLRAHVHSYPDVDTDEAEQYWAAVIGIDRRQFYKAQIDRRTGKSVEKHGKLRYGTIHVRALGPGTTDLHRRILGLIANLGLYIEEKTRD